MSVNAMSKAASAEVYKTYERKETGKTGTKLSEYGKTVGEPKLSEAAKKYYEGLKSKYSDMDFVLVSSDKMEQVKAQASRYATGSKTVVLIDEAKIEKMATDENYRKQYEGIIDNARNTLEQLKQSMTGSDGKIQGFGIQINDNGTVSFFAALKKSSADQRARIEKNAQEKKEDRRLAAKKATKERLEGRKTHEDKGIRRERIAEDTVTVSASSAEELLQKINDFILEERSNQVKTTQELKIGQHIDFQA